MWKKLHPKIATSEKHAKFGFNPFTLWTMMLPHTDTTGRYWANAAFIKGQCLPLFDHVRLEQVEEALLDLERVGLIHLFDVGGKRYLVYHDSPEHNPTGGLRYQKSEWPEPPPQLCGCLSRRDNDVVTAASPPPSLSQPLSEPPDRPMPGSPEKQLMDIAEQQRVIAKPDTLRRYVNGWLSDRGYQYTETSLMSEWTRGKDVLSVHDKFFRVNGNGNGKHQQLAQKPKRANAECGNCRGTGRRSNPVTGGQMDCSCLR